MKIIGVIMEVNPMHNGHIYFLNQIDKKSDDLLISIISTTIVQRGEITVLNKHDKARLLLDNNVDIVIELPYLFSNQGGLHFAKNAISILKELNITDLFFGSESNDMSELISISNLENSNDFKNGIYTENLRTLNSNDILGISYLKALKNTNIHPHLIKRIDNDYNQKNIVNKKIQSATAIRKNFNDLELIQDFLPEFSLNKMRRIDTDLLFDLFLINLNNCISLDLNIFLSENKQLLYKFKKILKNHKINDLKTFIQIAADKNNSQYKIKRIIINVILMVENEKVSSDFNYIHLLGFSEKGQKYISNIKNPKITSTLKNQDCYLSLCETKASNLFNILTRQVIKHDYLPPIIK